MQPLMIVDLSPYSNGRIAMSGVPGLWIDRDGSLGLCDVTLEREMARLRDHRIKVLVGLVEDEELGCIVYEDITEAARKADIHPFRLPLRDFGTPQATDEPGLARIAERGAELFRQGDGLAFHCIAGAGRSGMMAACLLAHIGLPPNRALDMVRAVQPEALETERQLSFLLSRRPLLAEPGDSRQASD